MPQAPDLIFYNGWFYTLDDRIPQATAAAVAGSRILAVGSDKEVLNLGGVATRKIDLENHLVLPGFWDTHFHFYEWALNLGGIDLSGLTDFGAMEGAVRKNALALGPGCWVTGQGFNETQWPENRIPDRHDLDRAAPDNPVFIIRTDCHLGVANSRALEMAGIYQHTPDPKEGVIEKDGAGTPTGILKELALNLVRKVIPPLSESGLMAQMEKAQAAAHSLGLTGIHDIRLMGGIEGAHALKTFQAFHQKGRLKLRTHVALAGERTDQAVALGLQTGFGDDMLRIGHLKFFADGGMGARTAWMTQAYLDGGCGMPLTPMADIEAAVTNADRAGLSCMVHAIGDRACREVIAMFARVENRGQSQCRIPHRIEHVQMILPEDLKQLGRLKNLAVSLQPANLGLDIEMIDQCVGQRAKHAYTFKRILEQGLPVLFSSDAPVTDPNPLVGIYTAVTRKRMDQTPEQGWYPDQGLGVTEVVRGYTRTPVEVSGQAHDLGSVSPGKLADLIVLDRNIFTVDPDDIPKSRVILTLVNGKIVYEA